MGTGGSLRLLSPETKQGLDPFAAAFLLTSDRPSNGLPTSFERLSLPPSFSRQSAFELPPGFLLWLSLLPQLWASHPQNRTGWFPFRCPTKTASVHPHILSQTSFEVSRFVPSSQVRSRFSCSLFPYPCSLFQDQALDRLVSSSSIRYRTSTDDLSTLSSSRGLTCFHSGNSILWGGFTLRCLQRLSRPHFASLLCRWHDNSCTRGASIPVLSY